ncbi:MAG TPA: Wzy polymerase domain-containing protein, partial [Ramlibacter sp.]
LVPALAYAAWDYLRVSQVYLLPHERSAVWADDAAGHARRSWLFSGPAGFAELTLDGVTRDNAAEIYALAERMLRYSPEPRVIERAIESATMLGHTDEAVLHLARYRAAFPADYEKWRQGLKLPIVRQP